MRRIIFTLVLILLNSVSIFSMTDIHQELIEISNNLNYAMTSQDINKLVLAIHNNGNLGEGTVSDIENIDVFTGQPVVACEYPYGSNLRYLYDGSIWIGAIVEEDTLVSYGTDGWFRYNKFIPEDNPNGNFVIKSTLFPDLPSIYDGAVSHNDIIVSYTDTNTTDIGNDYTGEPHIPLGIKITQSSYAWNYYYAEDIIFIRYVVENIGGKTLNDIVLGFYTDHDINRADYRLPRDDLTGFEKSHIYDICDQQITVPLNIQYSFDNDGDPNFSQEFDYNSVTSIIGSMFLRTPFGNDKFSYNWWVSNGDYNLDFGPKEKPFQGVLQEDTSFFYNHNSGTPVSNADKYYQMSNREIDYNSYYTKTILQTDDLWLFPDDYAAENLRFDISDGYDIKSMLSNVTEVDLEPGQKFEFYIAYLAGENLHTSPGGEALVRQDPGAYHNSLNFTDFYKNALIAKEMFDMPGVDTDGDGYSGQFLVCYDNDTTYITGDGVPDLVKNNCCWGRRGNVNYSHDDICDVSDIVMQVDYILKGNTGIELECEEEADINGDGGLDIEDVVYLVDYMFHGGVQPKLCHKGF